MVEVYILLCLLAMVYTFLLLIALFNFGLSLNIDGEELKGKLDRLILQNRELAHRNPYYNPFEHPHQIIPLQVLKDRANQKANTMCRGCSPELSEKIEKAYDLALPELLFNNFRRFKTFKKRATRLEGFFIQFPQNSGFFG